MSWGRALWCWIVAIALGGVYVVTQPEPAPTPLAMATVPAPVATAGTEQAYELDAKALQRVEVRRGTAAVTLESVDGRWQVAASPAQRTIPAGLVQAFIDQLVDSGHGERVGEDPADSAYGLEGATLRIDAIEKSGQRLSLVVGAKTPTGTAAYALLEPQGVVILVGLSLVYYADLLLG